MATREALTPLFAPLFFAGVRRRPAAAWRAAGLPAQAPASTPTPAAPRRLPALVALLGSAGVLALGLWAGAAGSAQPVQSLRIQPESLVPARSVAPAALVNGFGAGLVRVRMTVPAN